MDSRPIGVFDSGLGGLTCVRELLKSLPKESYVYFGDTARVPYGTRSKDVVSKFSLEDALFLKKNNVKCIVIACNTASSLATRALKKKLDMPIFEVIRPGAEEAVKTTKNKRVGLIATKATVNSNSYEKEIMKLDPEVKVFARACPLLVPLIEEGEVSGKIIQVVAQKYLTPLKKNKIDTLILGCTHYPVIQKLISEIMGEGVKLVNPEREVVKQVVAFLDTENMKRESDQAPTRKYYFSDITPSSKKVAGRFLGKQAKESFVKVEL